MEQYNFRLKEYRKIALKFYLAPWRVLVIDKWARLRLAQTSTRRYKIIRLNGKRERSGVAR